MNRCTVVDNRKREKSRLFPKLNHIVCPPPSMHLVVLIGRSSFYVLSKPPFRNVCKIILPEKRQQHAPEVKQPSIEPTLRPYGYIFVIRAIYHIPMTAFNFSIYIEPPNIQRAIHLRYAGIQKYSG